MSTQTAIILSSVTTAIGLALLSTLKSKFFPSETPAVIDSTLQAENESLQRRVQELEDEINQSDIQEYLVMISSQKDEIALLKQKLSERTSEEEMYKDEVEMMKGRISGLSGDVAEKDDKIKLLENTVLELTHTLDKRKEEIFEKETEIKEWISKHEFLKSENDEILVKIQSMDQEYVETIQQLDDISRATIQTASESIADDAYISQESSDDTELITEETIESVYVSSRESKWFNLSYYKNTPENWIYECSEPIILDNGSYSLKCGYSGKIEPDVILPNVVSKNANSSGMKTFQNSSGNMEIGESAWKPLRKQEFPVIRGSICNWDDMESVWDHTFEKVGCNLSESPLFFVQNYGTSNEQRDKISQYMFETMETPGMYFGTAPLMALLTKSCLSGIVVDCGYERTQIVPFFQGMHVFPQFSTNPISKELPFGGRDVSNLLEILLNQTGQNTIKEPLARSLKHQYASLRPENTFEIVHDLNDGQSLEINDERVQCAEIIFSQHKLHNAIEEVIKSCPHYMRKTLTRNIIPVGGSANIEGFAERLESELKNTLPAAHIIMSREDQSLTAWRGASIASSISAVTNSWVCREEFEEFGPVIMSRKCIF